jgi:hypothetical protein
MPMTPAGEAEKEFYDTLAFFKDYLNRPTTPVSNGSFRNYLGYPFLYREQDPYKDFLFQVEIKIMESGIFHKGGVKGKVLPVSGRGIHYKVWPISNLGELLASLTSTMTVSAEPEKNVREFVSDCFDNLLMAFDKASPIARLGGIRKPTIEKIKRELAGWKNKTISRIPKFNQYKDKGRIALKIAETLIAHLPPKTPDSIIAERTNELLTAFGKEGMAIRTLTGKIAKLRGNQSVSE